MNDGHKYDRTLLVSDKSWRIIHNFYVLLFYQFILFSVKRWCYFFNFFKLFTEMRPAIVATVVTNV